MSYAKSLPNKYNTSEYKVAVIETIWRGHTPTFFRIVAEAYLSLDCVVTLICPEPDIIKTELINRGYPEKKIFTLACSTFPGLSQSRYARPIDQNKYFQSFSKPIYYLQGYDLLYFSMIDPILANFWGLIYLNKFRTKIAGLWMHPIPSNQTEEQNWAFRHRLYEIVLGYTLRKHCIGLTTLDERAAPILCQKLGLPVLRFPDCAENNQSSMVTRTAVRLKKYSSGRKIIGIVGVQAAWKGVFIALKTIELLSKDLVWAFVGPDSKNEEEKTIFNTNISELQKDGYSIFTELSYIDDDDYNNIVELCDIIWCVYPHHLNSSNTLTKAALYRKPVLAINQGLIGERVSRFGLGVSVSTDVRTIANSISAILDRSFIPNYDGMERFVAEHDIANVKKVIAKLLSNMVRAG